MGLCSSDVKRVYAEDSSRPGQGPLATATFKQLGLSEDTVQRFFAKFCQIDLDGSGEIDLNEFYEANRTLDRSPFSDRVFSIMDADGSGEIDFREFVCAIWNFCTFELGPLVKFAFQLFDLDGSGSLETEEVGELIKCVYGDAYDTNIRIQRIMDRIDENGDGVISYSEFQAFNKQCA